MPKTSRSPGQPPRVTQCPESGLWLLPRSPEGITRYLPGWRDLVSAAREFVLPIVQAQHVEDLRTRREVPETVVVRAVFGLMPRPDNDWNRDAVAVIAPVGKAGALDPTRQIAWVKDTHLHSLRPSIIALAHASGKPAACNGTIELSRMQPDIDFDAQEDEYWTDALSGGGHERGTDDILSRAEVLAYGYEVSGFRADIASWEPTRDAVLKFIRGHITDRIVPVHSRYSPYVAEFRSHRGRIRDAADAQFVGDHGSVTVLLRADAGLLDAWWDGLLVSRLHPDPREFFARTHQRVLELGGEVLCQAWPASGGLEVLIEDSRFLGE